MQSHSLRTAALDARALLASCKRTLTCAEVATLMRTIATDGAGGPPPAEDLESLSKRLDHAFDDLGHLEAALTHPSTGAHASTGRFERLEFLGDRVLGLPRDIAVDRGVPFKELKVGRVR